MFKPQQLFSNRMKSRRAPPKPIQKVQKQSDDGDCSCQMLDTSLSNVGDSDCSCSECLEANLQAFNELKYQEQFKKKEDESSYRGRSTRPASGKQTRGVSKNTVNENRNTTTIRGFKSIDRMKPTRPMTAIQHYQLQPNQVNSDLYENSGNNELINDYIKITQHRARQYMRQRNDLKNNQQEKRRELKSLIKENLQALKFTAKNMINQKENQQQDFKKEISPHTYKWNHQPYHCKSKLECRRNKQYQPNLEEKQEEIEMIKQRIKQYQEMNKQKPYQCPDQCPRHHMRTSKKKLNEIDKFIKKKAKEYQETQRKAQAEKQKKQKIKQAKLRAIDLKCKQKVLKSKKYQPKSITNSHMESQKKFVF